ncbi:hypothetical protein L7E55_01840 [Pelotomaculum isophthalicicum JI]|uniref:ParB/Sulfiredoxin domain-containing protein n=1 Tax=Pelotomaculum isophthalicicum JI TaxID=947010 RepID=A0A9X4H4W2_9FIRM|nr:hypothetical protein [Pelotomaculum isophthalicicum]MDF9407109.1 hypothetical protein [Pelotomaculum isophthalicicum JI]
MQLLKYEEVVDLASDIIREKRLLPGDRIITCIIDGKHVVLEGNRRVCACQMLLNPTLVPLEYKKRFPKADSEELILNISQIKADVAPNRNMAENVLTKRHTEPGIQKWSPIAKMRRAARWFNHGETINEIASRLGASKPNVRRNVRDYHLLKYALDLPGWTQEEIDILKDEKLTVNPYTRFFTLSGVKELLKLSFNEREYPESGLPKKIFDDLIKCITKAFLLPLSDTGKPWANTRTTPEELFNNYPELSNYKLSLNKTLDDSSENENPKITENLRTQDEQNLQAGSIQQNESISKNNEINKLFRT